MRNYFTLNGVDSRDFGVYISGQGTFGAPQKAYNFYNIPGRDGALLSADNRLENVNLSYEAFIYKDFETNVANFRTFLLSLNGYARLEDSYHPEEFRYAVYTGPFEPTVQSKNDAGSFTITFSCKPQRFLNIGESVITVDNSDSTMRGNSLYLDGASIDTSIANYYINGINESGTPNNHVIVGGSSSIIVKYDGTIAYQSSVTASKSVYTGSINLLTGTGSASRISTSMPTSGWVKEGSAFYNSGAIDISSIDFCDRYTPDSTRLFNCIYYDADTARWCVKDSSYMDAASFNAAVAADPIMVAGPPKTSVSITVTPFTPSYPQQRFSLRVLSRFDEIEVGYYSTGYLTNPTYMRSKPLIRAYGNGVFSINNDTVTITNATTYTDIDCEMMDCYEGSTNRNNDVSFSPTYDFPTLAPGENPFRLVSGITKLEITPRWWRA